MRVKRLKHLGLIVFLLVLVFGITACDMGSDPVREIEEAEALSEEIRILSSSFEPGDLVADQEYYIGRVSVRNDNKYLYIDYYLEEGWEITETKVHLALKGDEGQELENFDPINRAGNPQLGLFDHEDLELVLALEEYGWEFDNEIIIAVYIEAEKEGTTKTAWAYGERFAERGNWATYFEYIIVEPEIADFKLQVTSFEIVSSPIGMIYIHTARVGGYIYDAVDIFGYPFTGTEEFKLYLDNHGPEHRHPGELEFVNGEADLWTELNGYVFPKMFSIPEPEGTIEDVRIEINDIIRQPE